MGRNRSGLRRAGRAECVGGVGGVAQTTDGPRTQCRRPSTADRGFTPSDGNCFHACLINLGLLADSIRCLCQRR